MNKPLIYIASPYTKGDVAINTNFSCKIWNQLMDEGLVIPYSPLWSHFAHILFPRPYEDWIQYDNELIPRMDACLRLNAEYHNGDFDYHMKESSGADAEVALFESLSKPVFYSIKEMNRWVNEEWNNQTQEKLCCHEI